MKFAAALIAILTLSSGALLADEKKAPEPAKAVLAQAVKSAGKSKRVMLIFHASWCGWCHKLDSILADTDVKKIVGDRFVVTHLDVMENGDKKSLENPGGGAMMATYGGEKSGLPFFVILDGAGKKLGDSNRMPNNQNMGCPSEPAEIEAFVKLLKETNPAITAAELGTLKEKFTEAAKKK